MFFFSKVVKKTKMCFVFNGKVHRPFIRFLRNPLFFLIKMCCVFFFLIFVRFFVFFFPRKSSSAIHSDFEEPPIFFNKNVLCFFLPHFCAFFCFFSFPRKSSHVIHSFDFQGRKKKQPGKKNSFFIHSKNIPQKCAKTILSG